MDFNARIELDFVDFDDSAIDVLMDVVVPHHGVVARAVHGGRVELIVTVEADGVRRAVITALGIAAETGHAVYALEVLPTEEFHRRIDEDAAGRPPATEVLSYP